MLKGDLTSTPLAPLLRDLANDSATGCLHVINPADEEALIFFKNGLVYSVSVPGTRPQLGAKLVSSGALAPEALAEALEAQRSELQGWRLGELLVHLGYVDQPVVEAFVMEQVNEALWDLLRWTDGRWKFRKNIRAREDVGPPMVVVELLATLRDRGYEWENISAVVHGPAAIPVLSARGGGSAETVLDNDAWSMLCKIDGERSVADLARDCGYTLFEAGQVIVQLVQAGLVDIDEDVDIAGAELYGATTLSSALAGDLDESATAPGAAFDGGRETGHPTDAEKEDVLARLARLVTEVAGDHSADQIPNGDHPVPDGDDGSETQSLPAVALAPPHQSGVTSFDNPMIVPLHRHSSESFAASIARVSNALSDVLGSTPETTELEDSESLKPVALKRSRNSNGDPEWQRRKRLRTAAAAELASAQAMVETLRSDTDPSDVQDGIEATDTEDAPAESEDASEELGTTAIAEQFAADQAEAERLAAEGAEQTSVEEDEHLAAEQQAAEEAERLAAEQAEADRLAAEEAERLAAEEAERAAIEELAWADYWQREGEERAAAEQAEIERLAAEEAEAERVAAEEAEAERVAAEEAEAERVAAEEAEAERVAAERAEAEHLAAEQAEQLAAEQAEAERVAAEEAEQQAAAYAEIERVAAEQAEAERLAAEEEERLAAEAAAQLAAAQSETDQSAADEAERIEEEEANQDAASAKEERAARRKAERNAAEDAAREADDAAAATALLVELAATSQAEEVVESDEVDQYADTSAATYEEPAADDVEPEEVVEPWNEAGQADTAALLRELSSLGIDDDEPSAPTASQRPRPNGSEKNGSDKKAKKKIGLFGR
jgi:Domain of unknown function (DUF4388)